jgi:hypothetical protein
MVSNRNLQYPAIQGGNITFQEYNMLRVETPTRIIENWIDYSFTKVSRQWTDEFADGFMESIGKEKFTIKFRKGVPNPKPDVNIHVKKPVLQIALETSSHEDIQAVKEKIKNEELEMAVRRKSIDIDSEMESWLGTIGSASTRRSYRSRIIIHFLPYCTVHGIDPRLMDVGAARTFAAIMKTRSSSLADLSYPLVKCFIHASLKTMGYRHTTILFIKAFGLLKKGLNQ